MVIVFELTLLQVEQDPIVEERYTKSPCFQDDCLFMTSMHSFPSPRNFIYKGMDLEELEHWHAREFDHQLFVNNPYHYAVDQSFETSWLSLRSMCYQCMPALLTRL